MSSVKEKAPYQAWIVFLYVAIAILHLAGELSGYTMLSRSTKPLLLPALVVYLFSTRIHVVNMRIRNLAIIAASFSFLGDVLLMFVNFKSYFFLMGLGAFLIAHFFYIFTFRVIQKDSGLSFRLNYIMVAVACVYYFSLIGLIYGSLEPGFRLPVMSYGVVITVMLVYSFSIKNFLPTPFNNLLFFGTCLFIISDSLIAVNKFFTEIPLAGLLIMSTYIGAQFLIIRSIIEYLRVGNLEATDDESA